MNKRKIINDPVYGFTTIPDDLIYDLVQHPYFQRLRRIKQLGLSDFVYPGAQHSRFQHALGALHLMCLAIEVLRSKGVPIEENEARGAQIAILLHDIGHSPFSHALEKKLVPLDHEKISILYMQALNAEFNGQLTEAIRIFTNKHPKKFLSQLVSGQLDLDRMDYLNRDSFFTGVAEGVIGYQRIIKMLNVVENQLVVEEKGIYSIEKFLQSRRIMYWQVYLHKTVLAAEKMLIHWFSLLSDDATILKQNSALNSLLKSNYPQDKLLSLFASIDDIDIFFALKSSLHSSNRKLRILANGLVNRNLFKCILSDHPIPPNVVKQLRKDDPGRLIFKGKESNSNYNMKINEIMIYTKTGEVLPLSSFEGFQHLAPSNSKYYLVYQAGNESK
ncbi:MAG: HD domain-containing protein [Saprospiraceae bacterium]|nr:HD domain-containing protein [Saprospiraceae bacterium]